MSHTNNTKLLDMDINGLYSLDKDKIAIILNDFYKEDLIAFAKKHDIPVKVYHSRPAIMRHLAQEIASTGMFRRIAGTDKKEP